MTDPSPALVETYARSAYANIFPAWQRSRRLAEFDRWLEGVQMPTPVVDPPIPIADYLPPVVAA